MEKRVDKLDERYDHLQGDVTLLKRDVTELIVDVSGLKKDVSQLQLDVAVIKSNYATKEDIGRLESTIKDVRGELYTALAHQTNKFVGWMVVLMGAGLGLAKVIF